MRSPLLSAFVVCAVLNLYGALAARVRRRCFDCHSRGDRGDCKDPFNFNNETMLSHVHGVKVVECASGWCGKQIGSQQEQDDFDLATTRLCLRRPPSDGEERCAEVKRGFRKKFMCFCHGDLCNSSPRSSPGALTVLIFPVITSILGYWCLR